ncbi:MAG: DUF933 domain-containing protein [Candidatus Shikimatogenerans bostrichidophilus]|nr:MAG: DUF933 domain-containing protein [Candidatus Shikimatogenerans bostrichidophilus]
MECGIIGLPNVGKSSFFSLLSNINNNNLIKNYPFSTINPNKSIINVYDKRLINLCKILNFLKYKCNNIKLIDIAGLIQNSYKGKGLGNIFLSYIRNTKVVINILRLFYNKKIININNNIIDPIYERKILFNELIMKDITILNRYIIKNKNYKYKNILNKILYYFKKKNFFDIKNICNEKKKIIKKFNFLILKPYIYICNIDKYCSKDELLFIKEYFIKKKEIIYFLNIKKEIINNNNNLGKKKKINKIIKKIFLKLKLNTFFTIDNKKKIIYSWKIKKKTYAYKASKKIHSTFSKKFIKVEVINYDNIIKYKKFNKKKVLIKGKKYIVKDGDILKFIINK